MGEEKQLKTGTTTVGIVCKDGVVIAADKRATAGYLIADRRAQKIHNITDDIAVTIAGTVSDAQLLIRLVKAELRLKTFRTEKGITVSEAANMMARLVYSNIRKFSTIPGVAHFIMAGNDSSGQSLYDIYADGSVSKVIDYVGSGSGSVMAYGVLETLYKPGMSVEDGVKLAGQCINAAVQRDIASGNGLNITTVTKDGAKSVVDKDVKTTLEA